MSRSYRVVCTRQVPSGAPPEQSIIVGIGTGDRLGAPDTYWTVDEVLMALDHGYKFHTFDEKEKKRAKVGTFQCSIGDCTRRHLRTVGDDTHGNDLNHLPAFNPQ